MAMSYRCATGRGNLLRYGKASAIDDPSLQVTFLEVCIKCTRPESRRLVCSPFRLQLQVGCESGSASAAIRPVRRFSPLGEYGPRHSAPDVLGFFSARVGCVGEEINSVEEVVSYRENSRWYAISRVTTRLLYRQYTEASPSTGCRSSVSGLPGFAGC